MPSTGRVTERFWAKCSFLWELVGGWVVWNCCVFRESASEIKAFSPFRHPFVGKNKCFWSTGDDIVKSVIKIESGGIIFGGM